jgi:uncharacterized damage-inducible protein DinB
MILEILYKLYDRDLERLYNEINRYNDHSRLWITDHQISNSAGNLCLHLIGNLNNYIGNDLGKSGYVRDREAEFSDKNVPVEELLLNISNTRKIVLDVINSLRESDLETEFPEKKVFDEPVSVGFLLIHLSTHLTYHLGQINYHRRLLDRH